VTTESESVNIRVEELDAGSWVMFELPGFTTAAAGTEQDSLDALRNASETSWFKAKDALWVKVVSTADIAGRRPNDADSLLISR
jgi:cell migration-inducing and hyaluronan-binding protein